MESLLLFFNQINPYFGNGHPGVYLYLQLAQLARQALQTDAGLLQLFVGGFDQVAVSLS